MYFDIPKENPQGERFGVLRTFLETESHKIEEQEPKVTFTQEEETGHAYVALNSRLARDPAGKATSETCSESYSKNVKTKFEPQRGLQKETKKRGRKHASLNDSSSDEDRPAEGLHHGCKHLQTSNGNCHPEAG